MNVSYKNGHGGEEVYGKEGQGARSSSHDGLKLEIVVAQMN